MNVNFLKRIYEKLPRRIKFLFAPVFVSLIADNRIYKNTIKEIEDFEHLDEQKRDLIQFELLKQTVMYAYEHVPYYRESFDKADFHPSMLQQTEDINRIPLLTKEQAVAAGEKMYSDESISCYESVTGGSSGQALKLLLDKASIYKERAFVNHYLGKYGYNVRKTRTLALWGHNKDDDYYYSPLKNEIVISPFRLYSEDYLDVVWDTIEKFRPEFIAGYPSAMYQLAQMMERHNKKWNFKVAEIYAENYTKKQKKYFEKIFGCKVIAYYGHTERAVFAEEYEQGYLFHKLYGYTEFLPMEDDAGQRIICTGFLSKKMPLIRYVTDDVATKNEYGYYEVLGHKFSEASLLSKNGEKIFKGAMTLHLEAMKKVKQYQYVQNERGKAYLDLVMLEHFTTEEEKQVRDYLTRRCEGQLDIEIRYVDSIMLSTRGKYIWALNNCEK